MKDVGDAVCYGGNEGRKARLLELRSFVKCARCCHFRFDNVFDLDFLAGMICLLHYKSMEQMMLRWLSMVTIRGDFFIK